jgi:hypothetical protein
MKNGNSAEGEYEATLVFVRGIEIRFKGMIVVTMRTSTGTKATSPG